jgi:hypothetical protein
VLRINVFYETMTYTAITEAVSITTETLVSHKVFQLTLYLKKTILS